MIGLTVHVNIFISAVSMVIQKPISPENDHVNLMLNILIPICRIFSNEISLKLVLFNVQNCLIFLKLFTDIFFCLLKFT